ncbi:Fe-S-containing protein [Paradesulfitobacterium aromaticivorans]
MSYRYGNAAYLTPAGRVMVASSFCEPCYSRRFHIEGDVLVCNTCGNDI